MRGDSSGARGHWRCHNNVLNNPVVDHHPHVFFPVISNKYLLWSNVLLANGHQTITGKRFDLHKFTINTGRDVFVSTKICLAVKFMKIDH